MKDMTTLLKETRTAEELIPPGGWLKNRTREDWNRWKQLTYQKRDLLWFPFEKLADPGQRAALRALQVPDDIVEWVSHAEAEGLLEQYRVEHYRYAAYEQKLREVAVGSTSYQGSKPVSK